MVRYRVVLRVAKLIEEKTEKSDTPSSESGPWHLNSQPFDSWGHRLIDRQSTWGNISLLFP